MNTNTFEPIVPSFAGDVEELSLLLPSWQIDALAALAEDKGLTVAQLMRRLVNDALAPAPVPRTRFQSA
jgi:hypothetical protein